MQILKKRRNDETSHESQVDQRPIDRGELSSESVNEMSQQELLESLEQLNSEFKEFEKVREGIRTRISSITQLVPRLDERRDLLLREIDETREVEQQIVRELPVFMQQMGDLLRSIPKKQEEKALLEKQIRLEQEKVKEIKKLLAKRTRDKKKIKEVKQQKLGDIAKIDEQIKQIKSVQEYGVDLVSTLVYASKKR